MSNPIDWDASVAAAAVKFPSLMATNFVTHLSHPGLLGDILRDLLRLEATDGSRNRTTPELADGIAQLQDLIGNDYSVAPFPEAMAVCTRGQSRRQVAERAQLPLAQVQRLATGKARPTAYDMEAIARAYGRPPEWFHAYRVLVLVRLVEEDLERHPERSAVLMRKVRGL